jgi:hypothetical protein
MRRGLGNFFEGSEREIEFSALDVAQAVAVHHTSLDKLRPEPVVPQDENP